MCCFFVTYYFDIYYFIINFFIIDYRKSWEREWRIDYKFILLHTFDIVRTILSFLNMILIQLESVASYVWSGHYKKVRTSIFDIMFYTKKMYMIYIILFFIIWITDS